MPFTYNGAFILKGWVTLKGPGELVARIQVTNGLSLVGWFLSLSLSLPVRL